MRFTPSAKPVLIRASPASRNARRYWANPSCGLTRGNSAIINNMMTLHRSQTLTRLVLMWFALFVGVATASPIFHPNSAQLVCSASGTTKVVVTGDQPDGTTSGYSLECPLCTGIGAPPPLDVVLFAEVKSSVHLPQSVSTSVLLQSAGASLPARGPPVFL